MGCVAPVISSTEQITCMSVFRKCPVCGETATVVPEMGTEGQKVFRCANQHQFTEEKNQTEDEEIWDHMPEWAQMFKHI